MTISLLMFILAAYHAQVDHPALTRDNFLYTFNTVERLEEVDRLQDSHSPYWWLDSGGEMIIDGGVGKTIQGALDASSPWRLQYASANPVDTDAGFHPQNIFRLITRKQWKNFRQEAYFQVTAENRSNSPNRNISNGLLLFNRYQDQNNLYYAGIRVDGGVVVKKKIYGTYYEMGYAKYFSPSPKQVGPDNLLPQGTWIGLRTEIKDIPLGSVRITLSVDVGKTGSWKRILSVVDDGRKFGGPPITLAGSAGIRTDFMDVLFQDFRIEQL